MRDTFAARPLWPRVVPSRRPRPARARRPCDPRAARACWQSAAQRRAHGQDFEARRLRPRSLRTSISSPERLPSTKWPMNCRAYPATNNESPSQQRPAMSMAGEATKQAGIPTMCSQKFVVLRCRLRHFDRRLVIGRPVVAVRAAAQRTTRIPYSASYSELRNIPRKKSNARMPMQLATKLSVQARPTPAAPGAHRKPL